MKENISRDSQADSFSLMFHWQEWVTWVLLAAWKPGKTSIVQNRTK